jgi:hypothetical protein
MKEGQIEACSVNGREENASEVLVGKLDPSGRSRHRWRIIL